jgi:hypothetical protein
MKVNALLVLAVFFMVVLFSYSPVNAQNEGKTKETVSKTKDVAVEPAAKTVEPAAPKHSVVVTDMLADSANKTNAATAADNKPKSTSKSFGGNMVTVTDNVVGQAFEDGKWLTVTNWDGTKWVSKRQWFPNKKQ